MHTLTLITVDVPDTTQTDAQMEQSLNRLVQALWGGSDEQKPSSIYEELIQRRLNCRRDASVSYTHLTLPTN